MDYSFLSVMIQSIQKWYDWIKQKGKKEMKKIFSIIILVLITISICACGNNESGGNGRKTITINLDEPAETGSLEYTIHSIEFTNKLKYHVSDGYEILSDDNVFAIVKYSIKNISKEGISLWNEMDKGYIAIGKIVYGDGYTYENSFYSNRPRAFHYNESSNDVSRVREGDLEPLTSEENCILFIILPKEIVENTEEKLYYEISFADIGDNVTLRYEVQNREVVEVPNIQDYLYNVSINDSNFDEFFDYTFEPCRDSNKEETGEYILLLRSRKYDEGLILYSEDFFINGYLDYENGGIGSSGGINYFLKGTPWKTSNPEIASARFDVFGDTCSFVKSEFVESFEVSDPVYDGEYPIWFSDVKITLKDGTVLRRLVVGDNYY